MLGETFWITLFKKYHLHHHKLSLYIIVLLQEETKLKIDHFFRIQPLHKKKAAPQDVYDHEYIMIMHVIKE